MVDETMFYFKTEDDDHYLGYNTDFDKPYYAGSCDIEDGFECYTAEELFNAAVYNGKSLKERWNEVVVVNIGGIYIDDWYKYVQKEGKH